MKTKKSYARFTPRCDCAKHSIHNPSSEEKITLTSMQKICLHMLITIVCIMASLFLLFWLTYWEGNAGFAYTLDHFYNLPIVIVFFLTLVIRLNKVPQTIPKKWLEEDIEQSPFTYGYQFERDSLNPASPAYVPMPHEERPPASIDWEETRC